MLGNGSRHAAQLLRAAQWPAITDTLAASRLLGPALHARWLSSSGGTEEDAKGVPYDQLSVGVHTLLTDTRSDIVSASLSALKADRSTHACTASTWCLCCER